MKPILMMMACASLLVSCSSLPVPGEAVSVTSNSADAAAVLKRSAAAHGDPWKRYRTVRVSYDGEWSLIATKLQPVITNPEFRKSSDETYQPRLSQVRQIHSGPMGTKEVLRRRPRTEVKFNGERSKDGEVVAAAALVADAYTAFLFGPSWLLENGSDFRLMEKRNLDGESCQLVAGRLAPGIGNSTEDFFIVWISQETGWMKRFQFTLNGMDSTRGADVDVVFSDHRKAPDGSVWANRFVERIQRPVLANAHDWRMISLSLDGRNVDGLINP